jgi:hypothetical protein
VTVKAKAKAKAWDSPAKKRPRGDGRK